MLRLTRDCMAAETVTVAVAWVAITGPAVHNMPGYGFMGRSLGFTCLSTGLVCHCLAAWLIVQCSLHESMHIRLCTVSIAKLQFASLEEEWLHVVSFD